MTGRSPGDSSALTTGSCWAETEREKVNQRHRRMKKGTDRWFSRQLCPPGDSWQCPGTRHIRTAGEEMLLASRARGPGTPLTQRHPLPMSILLESTQR